MPYVSDLLTAAAASVTGTPTPTRSWQWRRGATLISGATAETYTVTEADIGSALTVQQIERNVAGVATATSAATAAVQAFDPIALFQSGEEGAWYDPSDLTTLYQDSIGTTPVTAAGQPVGLMLDKSKGGLQAELVDTFNDAASWVAYGNNIVEQDGDAVKITYVDDNRGAYQYLDAGGLTENLSNGTTYRISFQSKTNTADTPPSILLVSFGALINEPLTQAYETFHVIGDKLTAVTPFIRPSFMAAGDVVWVRAVSVRELPGNHATQSTSTARPTLQVSGGLYYLDFDGVDDTMRTTFASTQAQPNTIAAAFKFDVASRLEFLVDGVGSDRHALYKNPTQLRLYAGSWITDPSDIGTNEHVVFGHLNTTSSDLRVDGSSVITGNPGIVSWGGVTLGGTSADPSIYPLNGRIYGFVGVNRTLTTAEIEATESYLATKSGVTLP